MIYRRMKTSGAVHRQSWYSRRYRYARSGRNRLIDQPDRYASGTGKIDMNTFDLSDRPRRTCS